MDTSPLTSSSGPMLPPLPPRGAHAPGVSSGQFREMLATQGIQPPASGGAPTETEARITAAQIASKANVNAGVKRDRVLAGMDTTANANVSAAVAGMPGRFMPLRQGPGAARNFTAPENPTGNSMAGLRATTKFAPGPVTNPNLAQAVPAVARALKTAPVETAAESQAASVPAPKAVEAYTYGLRASTDNKPNQVPPWFDSAVQSAMDKYDAMKAAH